MTLTKEKYHIAIARFPYGGLEESDVGDWLAMAAVKLKQHPRIGEISRLRYNDTPITMTRNRAFDDAQRIGADFIIMVDSDMKPDAYAEENPYRLELDPSAKPFLPSSLDFAIEMREKGTPCCVGAPYCGPPPWENVYVFKWCNRESNSPNVDLKLEQFSREETVLLNGILECAALPTGLILIDMAGVDRIVPPYTYYQWDDDEKQHSKASTEDVTLTRDMALRGVPQYCNWDAWAGHWKRKCVGRPVPVTSRMIGESYRKAMLKELNMGPGDEISVRRTPVVSQNGNGKPHAPMPTSERIPRQRAAKPKSILPYILEIFSDHSAKIIHVNCGDGKLTREMLDEGTDIFVICVDDWGSAAYEAFESSVTGFLGTKVMSLRDGKEAAMVKLRNPENADLILLESPSQDDIEGWLRHLGPHGILVGVNGNPEPVFGDITCRWDGDGSWWYVTGENLMTLRDQPAPPPPLVKQKITDRYGDLDLEQISLMVADRVQRSPERQVNVVHVSDRHDPDFHAVANVALAGERGTYVTAPTGNVPDGEPFVDVLLIEPGDPDEMESIINWWLPLLHDRAIVAGWGYGLPEFRAMTEWIAEDDRVQFPPQTNVWWFRKVEQPEPVKIGMRRSQ
jgi:hypothetical protein